VSEAPGEVITFYSYKGGTGRSMALANVAVLLAQRETGADRVLMIDWDLEAPGLHHFFAPHLPQTDAPGLLELMAELDASTPEEPFPENADADALAQTTLAGVNLDPYICRTTIAGLSLIKAGDFRSMAAYSSRVNTFQWESLYERSPALLRSLALKLAERFRYVLIDSRTGLTDISGICTMLLPEKLVVVFTPNHQSLTGVRDLVRRATKDRLMRQQLEEDLRPLVVYPLPSRIDAERDALRKLWRYGDAAQNIAGFQPLFEELFEEVYGDACVLEEYFNEVQVKHSPDHAYGESISVELDASGQGDVFSLTRSYGSLLEWVANSYLPWERLEDARTRRKLASLEETERQFLASVETDSNAWGPLETVQRQVLDLRRAAEGRSTKLVTAMCNLAATLQHRGEPADAKALLQEALSIAEIQSDSEAITLRILKGLAAIARSEKQFADAISFQTRLLQLQERVLGPQHPETIASREQVARLGSTRQVRTIDEVKVILAGPSGAGKTTLIRRLLDDRFRHDSESTHGIAVRAWDVNVQGDPVRLHVWDFGGQELMHATHQLFFTPRALYLLVLDARRDGDADQWLRMIEMFGGDAPVIIALNKSSDTAARFDRRTLQQRYVNIREFVETDCRTGAGIAELRSAIEREVQRLPWLHTPVPTSWLAVKEQLARFPAPDLSLQHYRQLCAASQIDDEGDRETLLQVLHDLGTVIHFEDPGLRHRLIVDPAWLVNSIYAILDSRALAEQRGEVSFHQLSATLSAAGYPWDVHRYLLSVMEKFELCIALDGDERFLFPEFLAAEAPDTFDEFRTEECVYFAYDYDVLPVGLIPRVIVRMRHIGGRRWRNGLVVKTGTAAALIESDLTRRQISIAVRGPVETRRRLLAEIRRVFDDLHASFTRLSVRELVPLPYEQGLIVDHAKLLALYRLGVRTTPEFAGNKVVPLDIVKVLSAIGSITPAAEARARTVFFSYSHKDAALADELRAHLMPLARMHVIRLAHERELAGGEDWGSAIDQHIRDADLIVVLLSADFLASDYSWGREMALALEAHNAGRSTLLPVIARACDLAATPFAQLQALPTNGRPVTSWTDRDLAWQAVVKGIRRAAEA